MCRQEDYEHLGRMLEKTDIDFLRGHADQIVVIVNSQALVDLVGDKHMFNILNEVQAHFEKRLGNVPPGAMEWIMDNLYDWWKNGNLYVWEEGSTNAFSMTPDSFLDF